MADQPYALFKDARNGTTYRVAADGQSKRPTSGNALVVDQFNLAQHGHDPSIISASDDYTQAWLDSVPG